MGVTFSSYKWGYTKKGSEIIHEIRPQLRKILIEYFGYIGKKWTYWIEIYGPLPETIDENGRRPENHEGGHFIMTGITIDFFNKKDALLFKLLGLEHWCQK